MSKSKHPIEVVRDKINDMNFAVGRVAGRLSRCEAALKAIIDYRPALEDHEELTIEVLKAYAEKALGDA